MKAEISLWLQGPLSLLSAAAGLLLILIAPVDLTYYLFIVCGKPHHHLLLPVEFTDNLIYRIFSQLNTFKASLSFLIIVFINFRSSFQPVVFCF